MKKFLSSLLAVAMLLSLMTFGVSAAEGAVNTKAPKGTATRAEVATMLMRFTK